MHNYLQAFVHPARRIFVFATHGTKYQPINPLSHAPERHVL